MLLQTPCIRRIARTWPPRIPWRGIPRRHYASTNHDDTAWFEPLRDEMLQREVTHFREHIAASPEHRLMNTATGFLPREWCWSPGVKRPVVPVGHHLIWFNAAVPTQELLPDGTDASQSPGHPWVRRMWAGGSLQIKPDDYVDPIFGFRLDAPVLGAERIKDVQLRGQGDDAKIFVTIERRFARVDKVQEHYRSMHGGIRRGHIAKTQRFFEDQLRDMGWGDAILKEERNLVFFKERTAEEMDAIKAGQLASVRYLDPPGTPHFSHSLTPDRHLLFRFSALTFNAHLIHLDRDYARNVEGHRNLLVHGPLSLTLMLQGMHNYLETHTEGKQVVESIEYRNLAPLYCDEEMRICGMEKKALQNGSVYDVWIEGPTGGVAVKGTVYTVMKKVIPKSAPSTGSISDDKAPRRSMSNRDEAFPSSTSSVFKRSSQKTEGVTMRNARGSEEWKDNQQHASFKRLHIGYSESDPAAGSDSGNTLSTSEMETLKPESETDTAPLPSPTHSSQSDTVPNPSGETPEQPTSIDCTSQPPSREVAPPSARPVGRAYRRNRPTRTQSYNFIIAPPPIRRVIYIRKPIEPIPIVRPVAASPYVPNPARTARRHSRFLREGPRAIEMLTIRRSSESLWRASWRQRRADWQQMVRERQQRGDATSIEPMR